MTNGKKILAVTHNGTFHTDDVFAAATLELFYEDIEIIRSREESVIENADVVFDVGGIYDTKVLRFDHHQRGGAGQRENGIPYASFGLVWKEYGATLCDDIDTFNVVDERLVQAIDANDCGYGNKNLFEAPKPYFVGDVISSFRPTWKENLTNDEMFKEAVSFAKITLKRVINHVKSFLEAQSIIVTSYEESLDKRVIELKEEYPGWKEILTSYEEPLFIIYPRSTGGWSAKAVPKNKESFDLRMSLPSSWGGLRGQELQNVTGVKDAIFCHTSLFLVVAESKDGIVQLLEKTIN